MVMLLASVALGQENLPTHYLRVRDDERPQRLFQIAFTDEIIRIDAAEPVELSESEWMIEDISESFVLELATNEHVLNQSKLGNSMTRRLEIVCKSEGDQVIRMANAVSTAWDGFVAIDKDGYDEHENKVHSITVRCLPKDQESISATPSHSDEL